MCGVCGVYNHPEAARLTYLGLYALQHRGQESSGIVASTGNELQRHALMGLVNQVFTSVDVFAKLEGPHAIGHTRYSTTGSSVIANAQPFLISFKNGQIAACHNGNLINASVLRKEMELEGSIFTSSTDTEVVMHLVARSKRTTLESMILDALSQIKGSFSMLFLTKDSMYAARDHYGNRPLILGTLNESFVVASETCAFDLVGARFEREIKPGEMVRIRDGIVDTFTVPHGEPVKETAQCVFEYIYFARPDSFIFGENVDRVRRELGRQLAKECPTPHADAVIGVPDSSTTAALGYAQESKIPYDIGLIRNHYIGRTFIVPGQAGRDFSSRIKFNPVKGVVKNKRIVVVDDSIVRATTMHKIISILRNAEPREIHLRISSPPIISPCYYGIDMAEKSQLIAYGKSIEEIREYLEVDSLQYLSTEGLLSVASKSRTGFCSACFTGTYPIE